ncbi:hypothetical protein HHK36_016866 [Tetracentron sinense]|uniref:RRM domain-containing protein n=1 Tax=Tetracentron sinense TaxID=13715 RepID=A0A834Z098_TETSI|nr:hypothetical protein HHK36_016866 [Tetracentron sinense]
MNSNQAQSKSTGRDVGETSHTHQLIDLATEIVFAFTPFLQAMQQQMTSFMKEFRSGPTTGLDANDALDDASNSDHEGVSNGGRNSTRSPHLYHCNLVVASAPFLSPSSHLCRRQALASASAPSLAHFAVVVVPLTTDPRCRRSALTVVVAAVPSPPRPHRHAFVVAPSLSGHATALSPRHRHRANTARHPRLSVHRTRLRMAAFRGISQRLLGPLARSSPNSCSSLLPPSQLIFCRGIASKLFVGGLSFYTTESALSEAFSQFGQVIEAKIIMDRVSDRSKGFGFVTFASEDEAQKAVTEMNGKVLNGRIVFVDKAKPSPRFSDGIPIARGPPEPTSDT